MLFLTLEKISFEQINGIKNDFTRANFENSDVKSLQSWVEFFFKFGRFPGSDKIIILPQCELPKYVKTDIEISPIDLFKKFNRTDAEALVSLQALAALNIHLGGGEKKYLKIQLKNGYII